MGHEPRKIVGKPKPISPFERLERLREFVRRFRPPNAPSEDPRKHGSWPPRKVVGRVRTAKDALGNL